MIPTDKQINSLIKKVQKQVKINELANAKKNKNNKELEEAVEMEAPNEIFNEMKKRPYTT